MGWVLVRIMFDWLRKKQEQHYHDWKQFSRCYLVDKAYAKYEMKQRCKECGRVRYCECTKLGDKTPVPFFTPKERLVSPYAIEDEITGYCRYGLEHEFEI